MKMTAIRSTSTRILLIDEDGKAIDDCLFNPNPGNWGSASVAAASCEVLAARHSLKNLKSKGSSTSANQDDVNENGYGNVAFLDGHVEVMTRKDALRQKYTGNPTKDPVDF